MVFRRRRCYGSDLLKRRLCRSRGDMCAYAARCFLSDVPFSVCSNTKNKNSHSAECRCISGVPLTAAVCRSPQTEASQSKSKEINANQSKSKQFASVVCRSHLRCANYRGVPLTLNCDMPMTTNTYDDDDSGVGTLVGWQGR